MGVTWNIQKEILQNYSSLKQLPFSPPPPKKKKKIKIKRIAYGPLKNSGEQSRAILFKGS